MIIEIPKHCPSCDSLLERVNDQLFCRNSNCGAVSQKKLENFSKVIKIKGLGPKTIEKLNINSIQDLYEISNEYINEKIGNTLGNKLYLEIEKSKNIDIGKFLAACSIPLIGLTAANKIATIINDPNDITYEFCKKAGLGDKASNNLVAWVNETYIYMDLPITFIKIEKENKSDIEEKYTVCITGKIKGYTKASLAEELSKYGVKVVNTVNKTINYLICDERKNSAKEIKAEELNVKIISFDNFKEII